MFPEFCLCETPARVLGSSRNPRDWPEYDEVSSLRLLERLNREWPELVAQRDGPRALGEQYNLLYLCIYIDEGMGRPGDPRAKILFRLGAQRPCYGRCDMAQQLKMPPFCTRRLALPALFERTQALLALTGQLTYGALTPSRPP